MKRYQKGNKIVLTADRTMMSEYHGGIFLGFSACVPRGLIPDRLFFSLFCPSVDVDDDGLVRFAPCGTRKIEAALLDYGFEREEVVIAHPDYIDKVVGPETRVVGITENDPLGIGPATSTFTGLFGGEAYMAVKFRELLTHPSIERYRPKIIVGGPGAWQLIGGVQRKMGIDCVVLGEGEKVVGPLFERAVRGKPIPEFVEGEVVHEEEIPTIRGATIDGVVEIARGCGRGCDFCEPTLQHYRCLPIEHILKEVEVNLKAGRNPLLHAEDVLRYGAKGLDVNKEAVIRLFKSVKNFPGVEGVGISHFALSSVASSPNLVEELSNILGSGDGAHFLSGQTGIETGSPKLMEKHMKGKCYPFSPEEWPDVVVNAFELLVENDWIPVSTIILGLPGETERDLDQTIELIEKLRRFKSLIVPLFLVAMGGLKNRTESFTLDNMTSRHAEAFLKCWEHNLDWAPTLFEEWSKICIRNGIVRQGLKLVFSYGISQSKKLIQKCQKDYEYNLQAMIKDIKTGKMDVTPLPARLTTPLLAR